MYDIFNNTLYFVFYRNQKIGQFIRDRTQMEKEGGMNVRKRGIITRTGIQRHGG